MKILITGVAGHLGSALASFILRHHPSYRIIGIDSLVSGYQENIPKGVEFHQFDCLSNRFPRAGEFDVIFHFAAFAAEALSPFVRRRTYQNTLEATAAVINRAIAAGCGRFVLASSIAVYGRGAIPFREEQEPWPIDPYGNAKWASERDLMIAGEQHGLSWTILRPHNIYGPGQSIWQRYRNVFGIWMKAALQGDPIPIFGTGRQRRAFTYIDEVIPQIWRAALKEATAGEIINIGGGEPCSIEEAAEAFFDAIGERLLIRRIGERHEVEDAWPDDSKAALLLGREEPIPLRIGLARMWGWAKAAWLSYPERRIEEEIPIEIFQRLPKAWALDDPLR